MNAFNQRLSLDDFRQMDMVSYLSSLGHEPKTIKGDDFWYCSPLRAENTPSFKVNRRKNIWIDFGGSPGHTPVANRHVKASNFLGGNLIDFALAYNNWTIRELMDSLNAASISLHPNHSSQLPSNRQPKEPEIKIVKERELFSYPLLHYLKERRIPLEIAKQYCKEISYEIGGNQFYAIGFKNDSGGFEIRNKSYKLSSAPKDITTINNGAKECVTMEGFFNFLSFITLNQGQENSYNYLILNTLSFFEKARPFMEQHTVSHLYLDRDNSGRNYTTYALSLSPVYKDQSHCYQRYKDLNDWHINNGKAQHPRQNIRM